MAISQINIVARRSDATRAFYRLLGLDIARPAPLASRDFAL